MTNVINVTDLRNDIQALVETLIPLAEAHPCGEKRTELLAAMEGTLRKNLMRLQGINLLCNEEKLASSALELTRNMIEDTVSIEYMLASDDPEQAAHRFYEFMWVQLNEDLEYNKLIGVTVNTEELPDTEEKIGEKYLIATQNYPDFLDKSGKGVRSWIRRDVEMMVASLLNKGALEPDQARMLARTYVNGSRKTHFNPLELLTHMDQGSWDVSSQDALKLSLLVSSASLVRLSTRYIDLISQINGVDTYHEIGYKANDFLKKLHSASDIQV